MAKFLIPLGVIGGLVCFWLLWTKVSSIGTDRDPAVQKIKQQSTTSAASAPSSKTPEQQKEKAQGAYDIYAESFVAWNSKDKALKTTEGGWYEVGEMSGKGYVTAVSSRRARIFQPDGREGWVVANKDAIQKPLGSPSPSPSLAPKEIIIARDATSGGSIPAQAIPIPVVTPIQSPTPFPISKAR